MSTLPAAAVQSDRSVVGLVCGAHMLSHFYIVIWAPLFLYLQPAFEVSYTVLGLLVTAFSTASGCSQYLMGILVDRFGARFVLIGGLTLLSGSIALMGLATDFWHLAVLATLAGVGNSVFHPADYTILGDTVRTERLGRAFSLHTFSGHIGWIMTPVVITFLAVQFGWRTAVILAGTLGLATAAMLFVQRNRLSRGARKPEQRPLRSATTWDIVTSPAILAMWLFFLMTAGIQLGMSNFLPTTLRELSGMSATEATTVLTGFLIGGASGVLTGGLFADRLRRLDLVASLGFGAAAAALVLAALIPLDVIMAVFVLGFAGFMLGLIAPSRDLLVKSVTPAGASGKTFGFVSTGFDVGSALGAPMFGFFLDLGAPSFVFIAAAILMGVALLTGIGANRIRDRVTVPAAAGE